MSTVTAATVEAILRVRDSNFSVSMNNADKAVKKVDQSVKSLTERLSKVGEVAGHLGGALTAGISTPLLAIGSAAVKATVELDSLKRGLTAVAGSSGEAEKQLVRLKEVAKLPGLGFNEAIQGSIRLQAAGFSANQAEKALKEFGNAIATIGGGKEQLDGVTLALSQIASKGKVSAEEINQLNERLPQIRQAMITAFGTADTEILQKAGITANEFIDTITDVFSRDQRVGDTLKNQFENAQQKISESLDRIGRSIAPRVADIFEKIAGAVDSLTSAFDRLPKEKQDFLTNLGLGAAFVGPALAAAGSMAKLAASLADLGVSVGVLKTLAAGGAIALAVTLSFAPHVGAALETKALNDKAAAQDATLPRLVVNSGHIAQLREFQQSKKRYPGHSPIINPLSEMGQALQAAGIGGDATPAQIDAAIVRMGRDSVVAKGELRAQVKAASPREAAQKALDAQKKKQRAIINATARAKQAKAEEDAKKEAERAAKQAAQLAKQGEEYVAGLDQRLGVLIAERAGKFSGQRAGISNDFDNALARANELGVGAQALPILKSIYDWENVKVNEEERGEKVARLGQSMMRDQAQLQDDLKARTDARIARQKALVAGSAEMQSSLAMSNPRLGTLPPGMGGAALAASPVARALGGGVARGGGLSFPQIRAQMAASNIARFGGDLAYGGVMDLAQGRNVLGNALERVKGAVFQSIGEEIGRGVERSLRKRLSKVFEDAVGEGIGDKLEKSLNSSLAGINASAGAILSGAYSLISALSRKKQFGLGSILGGIGGFLLGGPMGAMQGYNIGNALDNRDYGGAIMGGLSTQINTGSGGGTTTQPGPADGRAVKGGASIIVQHYGNNYGMEDLEGASYRQGRAIERQLSFNG
jgi:tape measure domain-containing protein